jgi:uncharacterized protein (TIRG00374 family)
VRKLVLRFLISALIGAAMLYLASREIDFSTTWSALETTSWWVLLPYFAAMVVQHFFRAWRWGHLLAPIAEVPFRRILPIASVGFFAIVALPLRMGELVRPYLIMDRPRIRMSHGLGTMAVERVFDGLFLALGSFIAVALARRTTEVPGWVHLAGLIAFGVFFTALVVLIMALWQRDRAVALCRRLFGLISQRLGDRLAHIAEGVVDGFKVLPNFKRLAAFLFATGAYWLLNAAAVWVLALGMKIPLSYGQSVAVMCLVGIGIMIPAGPGFIGNFELFAEGALGLYLPKDLLASRGAAYILTFHATNAFWYTCTGFLALLSPEVSFTRFWHASTAPSAQLEPGTNGRVSGKKLDKPQGAADSSTEAGAPVEE